MTRGKALAARDCGLLLVPLAQSALTPRVYLALSKRYPTPVSV
jgi:hypothetical protein